MTMVRTKPDVFLQRCIFIFRSMYTMHALQCNTTVLLARWNGEPLQCSAARTCVCVFVRARVARRERINQAHIFTKPNRCQTAERCSYAAVRAFIIVCPLAWHYLFLSVIHGPAFLWMSLRLYFLFVSYFFFECLVYFFQCSVAFHGFVWRKHSLS